MLKMDMEYDQGILFVKLKGTLNGKNSYKINNYLNPLIKKHNIRILVYDLLELEDIKGDGIHAILNSKYYIKCNKGKLSVVINDKLKDLISSLKLAKIKNINDAFKLLEMI